MSERERYRLGPDVRDDEELTDSRGRVVDDAYVEGAVEQALDTVRRRGRPSLSDEGESPLLRVRLSRELDDAIRRAAEQAGASRSEWVRQVLAEAFIARAEDAAVSGAWQSAEGSVGPHTGR